MNQLIAIGSLLAALVACVAAQTVYIDIDSGKIVGIDQGRPGPGSAGNPQHRYPGRPQQLPNYQPMYQNPRRPYQPQQPYMYPQYPQPQRPQPPGSQSNTLNAEWVCTDPKSGNTMIIATEDGAIKPSPGNPQVNPYQDNPWLQNQPVHENNRQGQDIPKGHVENTPTSAPQTTPPPSSTLAPFPKLDIDWTQFLDQSTKKPSGERSIPATDGVGIIQPRIGR